MSTKSDQHFKDACSAWDQGDLARAFELFSQAAEHGDASCQLNLGYFYDCGLHVERDQTMARHWYHMAYRQGKASAASTSPRSIEMPTTTANDMVVENRRAHGER